MPLTPGNAFEDFILNLKGIRRIALLSAGGVILLPYLAGLGGYLPPWPPGIVGVTSLLELVVLAATYQFFSKSSRKTASIVVLLSMISVFVFSTTYLSCNAMFVYQIPLSKERVILGCGLSYKSKKINAREGIEGLDECPGEYDALLSSAQYKTDHVWTKKSVIFVKLGLVTSWLASFASLAVLLGTFVAFQRSQPARPKNDNKEI